MGGKNLLTESAEETTLHVAGGGATVHRPRVTLTTIDPGSLSPDEDLFWFQVYASTRTEELAVTGWDAVQRDAFLRMQYLAQKTSYQAQFPNAQNYAIHSDGVAAGRLIINRSAAEIELIDVALLPDFRRQGIGAFLMGGLLQESSNTGKAIRLYVERFNPALQWYERLGFRTVNESAIYLEMVWRPVTQEAAN
jgi:ribosomal protein S18 acetylase RimI-like enzyme